MVKNGFIIALLFLSVSIMGQDTIRKKTSFDAFRGFQINTKLIDKGIEIDENIVENDISYLFYSKKESLPFTYKFDPKKYLDPIVKERNFMYGPKPLEDDVMVVKYFEGVDKTKKEFRTTLNLGTIESNTKYLRIEYRDFSLIDGDRVRIYINKEEAKSNIDLDGLYYTVYIELGDLGYYRVDVEAINQGFVGPNTAEYIIYDDKGVILAHDIWNLNKGEIATFGIVRY